MTVVTTSLGIDIEVSRVDRRELDKFASVYPAPKPPIKLVQAWGSEAEEVEDDDDPEYIHRSIVYRVKMAEEYFSLFSKVMIITGYDWQNDWALLELVDTWVANNTQEDYLKFVALADQEDLRRVVEEILYLSTTTERGISESEQSFDVSWYDQPIQKFKIKTIPGGYSRLFEDRKAARWAQYSWSEFCALPGYEQSAVLAHFRLETRLEYLIQKERK